MPLNTQFPNNPFNYQVNPGGYGMIGTMNPMTNPYGTMGPPMGPMPTFGVPPAGADLDSYGYSSGVYSGYGMGPYGTGYSNGGGVYMDEDRGMDCLVF